MTKFEGVIPILSVKSVPASIDYYVSKLGFKKCWDWGAPPTFGAVARDGVEIFLCQGAPGQSGTWMSIFVDDVDGLHEEYKRAGATIRQAPTNFPCGMREMNVEDLDGHRLRMGSGTKEPPDGVPLCR
jgi:hypothetical protein